MTDSAPHWRLEGENAELTCGPLQGRVAFDPLGVRFLPQVFAEQAADKFGVFISTGPVRSTPQVELPDCYVRGGDLVATYAKLPPHLIQPQLYWRASSERGGDVCRLELVLSMQTELLDSDPQASVMSFGWETELFHTGELIGTEFERVEGPRVSPEDRPSTLSFERNSTASHLFVFRHAKTGVSYAQMVHPSDFVSLDVHVEDSDKPWLIDSKLFSERMEKGVIRRARICGWFLPAENDLAVAVELARQFIDEPLPLTT